MPVEGAGLSESETGANPTTPDLNRPKPTNNRKNTLTPTSNASTKKSPAATPKPLTASRTIKTPSGKKMTLLSASKPATPVLSEALAAASFVAQSNLKTIHINSEVIAEDFDLADQDADNLAFTPPETDKSSYYSEISRGRDDLVSQLSSSTLGDESGMTTPYKRKLFILDHIMIHISTLTGKVFNLEVHPTNTLGELKYRIYEQQGILTQSQQLIFCEKHMTNNDMTLEQYGIKNGSSLKLTTVMAGGYFLYYGFIGIIRESKLMKQTYSAN